MGKRTERNRSKTLPSSPTHSFSSSSSSDFEFRISISPRKSSAAQCPADELFYKGKLLPLHISPRISMVRTLLLSSSSTSSSSDTTTTASRDSSSSNDSTSSSFAADLSLLAPGDPEPDPDKCCPNPVSVPDNAVKHTTNTNKKPSTTSKYLSRISSVFKKDNININVNNVASSSKENVKKINSSPRDMIRKYLNKVKPLYDKLSSKQHGKVLETKTGTTNQSISTSSSSSKDILLKGSERSQQSFSGNLKTPKGMIKRGYVASCPSSMRSSPNHSGVLTRSGLPARPCVASTSQGTGSYSSDASTMEELQNAIQGAIAHCKTSMLQSSASSFNIKNNNNNVNYRNNKKCKSVMI